LKRINVLGKKVSTEHSTGNKEYQKKWLQHVQRIETNRIPRQAGRKKERGTTEEEMEGPTPL
jgi:uncharacterized protein YnzC (UPF0291/DUF896 family)